MPPRRKQKSAAEKKEDAERQKRILCSKEKILSIKRKLLSIIEIMIEKDVSKEWFLDNCTSLCHADYDDVIQERSIEHMCGYPLCNNTVKQTLKQKYHISRITNKVYDLTERKSFCSNQCYKASNYLRAQLSPIPLYMRKEETIKIHLLSDSDNRGSVGEEIVFHHTIFQDEIDEVYNEETPNNLKNMLNEEVKKCADSLADLQIKEHKFEKQYVFCEQVSKKSDISSLEDTRESSSDTEDDSDDSLDEKLFTDCDNISVLSQKHMPIPEKMKKTVLIPPLKPNVKNAPVQQLSLDFVVNVFKDWMTEDSMKYLLGEKYVYDVKAEHLFQRMTSAEPLSPERLSSIKNEYIKLCLKIDSLPDENSDISDSFELDIGNESSKNISSQVEVENSSAKKVFKRRPKKKSKGMGKHVTFSQESKSHNEPRAKKKIETVSEEKVKTIAETKYEEKSEAISEGKIISQIEEQIEQTDKNTKSLLKEDKEELKPRVDPKPEPMLPLVDSVSQNSLRKQLLTSKLKSAYTDLLPIIGLHYTDIREEIRKFVDTLSLTPKNIVFKPKEWKLISVVLLRMLTETTLKDDHDDLQLIKLYEDPVMPIAIDVIEIERTVSQIISAKNIINIH